MCGHEDTSDSGWLSVGLRMVYTAKLQDTLGNMHQAQGVGLVTAWPELLGLEPCI